MHYRLTLLISVAVISQVRVACHAQEVSLDLKNLGVPSNVIFKQVNEIKNLPASVVRLLPDGIANPKERFQVGDVIVEESLPLRRLIVGATAPQYCLLHYERGGRAKSYLVVLFRLDGQNASVVRVTYTDQRLQTIFAIKGAVENGRIKAATQI
jgi:hypothetical protein